MIIHKSYKVYVFAALVFLAISLFNINMIMEMQLYDT